MEIANSEMSLGISRLQRDGFFPCAQRGLGFCSFETKSKHDPGVGVGWIQRNGSARADGRIDEQAARQGCARAAFRDSTCACRDATVAFLVPFAAAAGAGIVS